VLISRTFIVLITEKLKNNYWCEGEKNKKMMAERGREECEFLLDENFNFTCLKFEFRPEIKLKKIS
jgi:hypothetical protein